MEKRDEGVRMREREGERGAVNVHNTGRGGCPFYLYMNTNYLI